MARSGLSHVIADIGKWDGLGMSRCNPFGILVDGQGGGRLRIAVIGDICVIGSSEIGKPETSTTDQHG